MSDLQPIIQETLRDDFELLRQIGVGSKSFVYLARERALRRLVAIKVLKPAQAENQETRKRFGREGRSMAKIHHPNVVAVHRVGELGNGLPFIVMEYINGRTLRDWIDARGPLQLGEARRVLGQVSAALKAAHSRGIIHRDLRPENVLQEVDSGRIVLTDFGIAGIAPEIDTIEAKLTVQGQLLGNPHYSSPEQLEGDTVSEQTDSYSFGIMGYELLTRRLPYDETTNVGILNAHLRDDPIPLLRLRSDVDPELATLLERCLSKKPGARPTAADLHEQIEALDKSDRSRSDIAMPSDDPMNALKTFQDELSRRHVGKVSLIYLALGFFVLNAGDIVLEPIGLDRLNAFLVLAYLIGFPVTLVLAWIYDITSEGLKRTESRGETRALKMVKIGAMTVSVAAALAFGLWYFHG